MNSERSFPFFFLTEAIFELVNQNILFFIIFSAHLIIFWGHLHNYLVCLILWKPLNIYTKVLTAFSEPCLQQTCSLINRKRQNLTLNWITRLTIQAALRRPPPPRHWVRSVQTQSHCRSVVDDWCNIILKAFWLERVTPAAFISPPPPQTQIPHPHHVQELETAALHVLVCWWETSNMHK